MQPTRAHSQQHATACVRRPPKRSPPPTPTRKEHSCVSTGGAGGGSGGGGGDGDRGGNGEGGQVMAAEAAEVAEEEAVAAAAVAVTAVATAAAVEMVREEAAAAPERCSARVCATTTRCALYSLDRCHPRTTKLSNSRCCPRRHTFGRRDSALATPRPCAWCVQLHHVGRTRREQGDDPQTDVPHLANDGRFASHTHKITVSAHTARRRGACVCVGTEDEESRIAFSSSMRNTQQRGTRSLSTAVWALHLAAAEQQHARSAHMASYTHTHKHAVSGAPAF